MNLRHPQSIHRPVHESGASKGITIIAVAGTLFALLLIAGLELDQIQSALVIGIGLCGICILRPSTGIICTFVYLAFMGDIRRWVVAQAGVSANDPLLLVGPAAAVLLMLLAALKQRIAARSLLSKLIFALMVIMTMEIFNPLQGGIAVGVAGSLFFMVPLLWFWIGHAWGSGELLQKVLSQVVVPIAVFASVLGLVQAYFGFLHFEAMWFRLTAMAATRPDMRPFAFFCSWAEYPSYVAVALVIVLVPLFQARIRLSALATPLFAFALVIQSVREAIYGVILALAVLWSVGGKSAVAIGGRLLIALLLGGGLLVAAMTQLKDVEVSDQVKQNIEHTTSGVLDIENSTAGVHLELVGGGFTGGVTNPIGYGLGYPTQAGLRAGGHSSEIDFSDVFLACGIVGGCVYFCVMFMVIRAPFLAWRDQRNPAALYVLVIIALELGHWLSGGAYAVSALTWFAVGCLDRVITDSQIARPAQMSAARFRPRFQRPKLAVTARPA